MHACVGTPSRWERHVSDLNPHFFFLRQEGDDVRSWNLPRSLRDEFWRELHRVPKRYLAGGLDAAGTDARVETRGTVSADWYVLGSGRA